MNTLALMESQRALHKTLTGDTVLMGMVTGVFDVVPQHTALPYIEIGDGAQTVISTLGSEMHECQFGIDVWTEVAGRKSALAILNRIHGLLHLLELDVTGFAALDCRVLEAATSLQAQGTRLLAQLRVRIRLEEV